jgi:hypothetical protein
MEVCWLPAIYFCKYNIAFLYLTGIRTGQAKSYVSEDRFNDPDLLLKPENIAEVSLAGMM